jgi:hypothetical protein
MTGVITNNHKKGKRFPLPFLICLKNLILRIFYIFSFEYCLVFRN